MIRTENGQLAVFAGCHFLMDFLCCFLLVKSSPDALWWIAGYHGLAFALQPVIGMLTDRYRNVPYGLISAVLILLAYMTAGFSTALASVTAGLGNALLHLEGGYVSMHRRDHRMGPLGLFVAPGAVGIGLGKVLGASNVPMMIGIAGCTVMLVLMYLTPVQKEVRERRQYYGINKKVNGILLFAFLSVMIRSYAGFIVPVNEFSGSLQIILAAVCSMLGKLAGGYLADRYGAGRTAVCSQSAGILLFTTMFLPVSLLFVFLINIPMAMTLASMSDCLQEDTGSAFGLAPLGLFIGYLLNAAMPLTSSMKVPLCTVLMCICAYLLYHTIAWDGEKKI